MNRRDFLKASVALAFAPKIASAADLPGGMAMMQEFGGFVSINAAVRAQTMLRMELLHSMIAHDLVLKETPRERWGRIYRGARVGLREEFHHRVACGEIGSYENVRLIESS